MRKTQESEIARLQAALKRAQMKTASLEQSIEQRVRTLHVVVCAWDVIASASCSRDVIAKASVGDAYKYTSHGCQCHRTVDF